MSWVVLVACIIPWVDAYSVWRGPTKQIVANHAHVFDVLSFAFPVPGEHAAANLGVPDLLFFALFLGAAARFGLRVLSTFVALVAGLGLTIAATVVLRPERPPRPPRARARLPAPERRPALIARLRGQPGPGDRPHVAVGGAADDG